MRSVIRNKQLLMAWSTTVCLLAFTAALCMSSEVNSGQASATATTVAQASNPCAVANPCAAKAKNPCAVNAANPCAAKNPCAGKNPCAASARIDPRLVTRPARTRLFTGAPAQLVTEGKRLWNDRSLGTSGLACGTCHLNHANFNPSFVKPFPHAVAMTAQRAGLTQVNLDEMVQFCMMVPMASKPLAWDSKELAALTAYAGKVQQGFIKAAAANPCMAKPSAVNPGNPCAGKR